MFTAARDAPGATAIGANSAAAPTTRLRATMIEIFTLVTLKKSIYGAHAPEINFQKS